MWCEIPPAPGCVMVGPHPCCCIRVIVCAAVTPPCVSRRGDNDGTDESGREEVGRGKAVGSADARGPSAIERYPHEFAKAAAEGNCPHDAVPDEYSTGGRLNRNRCRGLIPHDRSVDTGTRRGTGRPYSVLYMGDPGTTSEA